MTILVVKGIDAAYRGLIKSYMLEIKPMVFVAVINKKTKDYLISVCMLRALEFVMFFPDKNNLQGIGLVRKGFSNIKEICGLYTTTL